MLDSWARVVNRKPWHVLLITLVLVIAGGIYGSSVFSKLGTGNDFQDPSKSSAQAYTISKAEFGDTQSQLILLFSSPNGVITDPNYSSAIKNALSKVSTEPHVVKIQSYFSSGQSRFIAINKTSMFANVTLNGSDNEQKQTYENISNYFKDHNTSVVVRLGGAVAINDQINQQITSDLKRAETLSLPIVAVLLILIFGNIVAATVPLILGGLSILGALFITRLLTDVTSMSAYVINVITLLGLGLAIDYSLFLVGRFREELTRSDDVEAALRATVGKAGRTIMFSGLTVIISLLSLIVFPEIFLHSMGMSGAAVVASAVLLSITMVPALLRILGHRINALSLPGRNRRTKKQNTDTGFWYQFSQFIMRHPVAVLLGTLAVLVVLGLPFLNAKLSSPDIYSTPKDLSSRQVNDALNTNYKGISTEPISVIVHETGYPLSSSNVTNLQKYITTLKQQKGVIGVDSYLSHLPVSTNAHTPIDTVLQSPLVKPLLSQYISGQYVQLSVYQSFAPQSKDAQNLISRIRTLHSPSGYTIYVGGVTGELVDLLASIREHLPVALAIIMAATSLLIFMLMGGVLVPIKAIILGIISLSATFGILVWIFQSGHFVSYVSLTSLGSIDATSAVLIFAIAFGLSMDYEFFLLSRIKEEYEKTNDNTHSVAYGVQKTAGIITSAALLLISVISLFTISKISLIQQIGLGLAIAVAIDSTLVRMVLVPATMRLLGRANWWAPRPLKRFYERFGLHD